MGGTIQKKFQRGIVKRHHLRNQMQNMQNKVSMFVVVQKLAVEVGQQKCTVRVGTYSFLVCMVRQIRTVCRLWRFANENANSTYRKWRGSENQVRDNTFKWPVVFSILRYSQYSYRQWKQVPGTYDTSMYDTTSTSSGVSLNFHVIERRQNITFNS